MGALTTLTQTPERRIIGKAENIFREYQELNILVGKRNSSP
jgi:hypothetical protein